MKANNVISILTINEILTTQRHPQVQYRPLEYPLNMQTARCWRDLGHRCTSTNRTRNLRPFVNQLPRAPPTSSTHELRPRAPPTSSAPELRPRTAITSFWVFATTQSLLISLGLLMAIHRLTSIASWPRPLSFSPFSFGKSKRTLFRPLHTAVYSFYTIPPLRKPVHISFVRMPETKGIAQLQFLDCLREEEELTSYVSYQLSASKSRKHSNYSPIHFRWSVL